MAVLDFPIEANSISWGFDEKDQALESPMDDTEQAVNLTGGKWRASIDFVNVTPSRMSQLRGFLMKLKGQAGRFYLSPPNYKPQGYAPVSTQGRVNGGSQVGNSLITDGWTPSLLIFKSGDYIEVNGELKVVVDDCMSNATGQATLSIEPELRTSPLDNGLIEVNEPRCVMKLVNGSSLEWAMSLQEVFHLSLECKEVV